MDERMRFVARLLEGEKMATLCGEFGISHQTGYEIFRRYRDSGLQGLKNRSRRPYHQANKLPLHVENTILKLKGDHPAWGPPKLHEKLIRSYPQAKPPATNTIHAGRDRHGVVQRRKRRRIRAQYTEVHGARRPIGLWCADYKGEFRLVNRHYC